MNIVFIGSSGPFSTIPLEFLLSTEHRLCFIAGDGCNNDSRFPILKDDVESLAFRNNIATLDLRQTLADTLRTLKKNAIDLIVMSCYERKLPDEILALPKWGSINLHPSLLPAFRGPVPLFWQFRQGTKKLGISLHKVTDKMDAGPIIGQLEVSLEEGLSHQQILSHLAEAGIPLIAHCLDNIEQSYKTAQLQNESLASSMSFPRASDFIISSSGSARNLFNFIRATQYLQQPYPCDVQGERISIHSVSSYKVQSVTNSILSINHQNAVIPCRDGLLFARLTDSNTVN